MTRDEIQAIPASRELDFLVAEKVMGWRREPFRGKGCLLWRIPNSEPCPDGYDPYGWDTWTDIGTYEEVGERDDLFCFSRNIADTWLVVERMKSLGYSFACWDVPSVSSVQPGPIASFRFGVHPPNRERVGDERTYSAIGESMAEAICRAALLAPLWLLSRCARR